MDHIEIERLIEDYRAEKIDHQSPRFKQFRAEQIKCEAIDLSGKPVEGDCVVCVSHSFNNGQGYSKMEFAGKPYFLHRLSWELANQCSIPEGYQVDHICHNRTCINPKHLQVLSGESHRLKTLVGRGKRRLGLMVLRTFQGEEICQVWVSGEQREAARAAGWR